MCLLVLKQPEVTDINAMLVTTARMFVLLLIAFVPFIVFGSHTVLSKVLHSNYGRGELQGKMFCLNTKIQTDRDRHLLFCLRHRLSTLLK